MEAIQVQNQIRQNAEEVSSFLSEISSWEDKMNKGVMNKSSTRNIAKPRDKNSVENSIVIREGGTVKIKNEKPQLQTPNSDNTSTPSTFTPSSIISSVNVPQLTNTSVSKARGAEIVGDIEEQERTHGNNEFKDGNYVAAIKSYTKCLGLKPKNFTAFSNRAIAYIRTKEFNRAEIDCNCALAIEPNHCKSLLRRATARNALGKHRAALQDLESALLIEPNNKDCLAEMKQTRDLIKTMVYKAPFIEVPIEWENDDENLQGPDLPLDTILQSEHLLL